MKSPGQINQEFSPDNEELRVKENLQTEMLAERLASARDEERNIMAMEIHDVIGQGLTIMKLDLAMIARKLPAESDPEIRARIDSVLKSIDENIQMVRNFTATLSPVVIEDFNLLAHTIRSYCRAFEGRTGIRCSIDLSLEGVLLSVDACNGLFRIFQEAMTNIARHSEATEVVLWLRLEDGDLEMGIQDNGKGIALRTIDSVGSLGIVAMQRRAASLGGELSISQVLKRGTFIRVRLPLERQKSRSVLP